MIQSKRLGIGLTLCIGGMLSTASALAETWYVDVNATDPPSKVCNGDDVTVCDTCADCPKHCEINLDLICINAIDCPGSTPCIVTEKCVPVETTSWCNASLNLHDVLAAAFFNDTIMVADGTYLPDPTCLDDPREATLLLPLAGVTIKGGYAGCGAADPDERDPLFHETILSGDLGVEDDPSDNSYHVVTAAVETSPSVVVDGFTITEGNANKASLPHNVGGGFYTVAGDPTFINCTFRDNAAYRGGGAIYHLYSDAGYFDCVIRDNASFLSGGGVYNNDSAPTLTNCLITGNTAQLSWGGGMWSNGSYPELYNCTVIGNSSNAAGGGLYFVNGRPKLFDCILWGNTYSGTSLEGAQITFDGTAVADDVLYSCIQGCDVLPDGLCEAPTTNIGNDPDLHDPRFVPGPLGCYYLSQTPAGEPEDSPCVDAGSKDASAIELYTEDTTTITLAQRTTRSDLETCDDTDCDAGTVDMGYHYPASGLEWSLGDYDGDGLVTLYDYTDFVDCFTGAEPADMPPCCRIFDYELNRTVDLADYAEFQVTLTGE